MNTSKEEPPAFKHGANGDEFKPIAEVLLADVRQKARATIQADGVIREIQLEDFHKRISELNLNSTVPEDIHVSFDTARNLMLYSWFAYRFHMVADLQAYATLEFALRKRREAEGVKNKHGLSKRLKFAIKKGWLRAEGIRVYQRSSENRKRQSEFFKEFLLHEQETKNLASWPEEKHGAEYLQRLTKSLPALRNELAHGSSMLHGGSVLTLEICCDLINQLFPQNSPHLVES